VSGSASMTPAHSASDPARAVGVVPERLLPALLAGIPLPAVLIVRALLVCPGLPRARQRPQGRDGRRGHQRPGQPAFHHGLPSSSKQRRLPLKTLHSRKSPLAFWPTQVPCQARAHRLGPSPEHGEQRGNPRTARAAAPPGALSRQLSSRPDNLPSALQRRARCNQHSRWLAEPCGSADSTSHPASRGLLAFLLPRGTALALV